MIGCVDVAIQAQSPNMPLFPMRAFVGSPSSVRLRNVPKKIGKWNLTNVYFVAAYPDGSIKTASCELVGGVWVGTVEGSTLPGTSENGYSVMADGIDEHGNPVVGYVLGKGLIEILDADGSITPGTTVSYVHLLSAEPSAPKDGDLWPTDEQYMIWQDGEAHGLGGMTSAEVSAFVTATETAYTKWQCDPDIEAEYDYAKVEITYLSATGHWDYKAKVKDTGYAFLWGTSTETGENALSLTFMNEFEETVCVATRTTYDINSLGFATYDELESIHNELESGLSAKQDALTPAQMAAVNSGIT